MRTIGRAARATGSFGSTISSGLFGYIRCGRAVGSFRSGGATGASCGVKNHMIPVRRSFGLFGVKSLDSPQDFAALAETAVAKATHEVDHLLGQPITCPHEAAAALDRISNYICTAIDPAELCRSVHTNQEFVDAAETVFQIVGNFINKLNTNTELYKLCVELLNETHSLTAEESAMVNDLRREFEANGVHLKLEGRKHVSTQMDQISRLESKFMREISAESSESFRLGPISSLSREVTQWVWRSFAQGQPLSNDVAVCGKGSSTVSALLNILDSNITRECVWINTYSEPSANVHTLGELIKRRQDLALHLGFKSYAHKVFVSKAFESPEAADNFLRNLGNSTSDAATKAVEILQSVNSRGSLSLAPWDVDYCMQQFHRSQGSNGGKDRSDAMSSLSSYFSIDTCLDGLKLITYELFGLRAVEEPLDHNDGWASADNNTSFAVKKLRIISDENLTVGILYLDLWQRPAKFPGNAHFTVQCGCLTDAGVSQYTHPEHQLPVFALVLNLRRQLPKLLRVSDLELLYHEWGHAMHSLLSKTRFQHLSGTRCSVDVAEVEPSS
jgi:intermediate peptidase